MSGPCSTTTASTDQALRNGASLYGGLPQWSLSLEVSRVSHLEPKRSRQQIPETKMGKSIFGMSRKRIRLPQSCAYTERRMAVNMVCLFLHISSSHQKRHRLPVSQSVDKIRRIFHATITFDVSLSTALRHVSDTVIFSLLNRKVLHT